MWGEFSVFVDRKILKVENVDEKVKSVAGFFTGFYRPHFEKPSHMGFWPPTF